MIAVVNSVEIGYDDVGVATGVPVLFIHAFPLNRTMWAPQVSAMVERCRCIAADLRGFGESVRQPPYSMEQYADAPLPGSRPRHGARRHSPGRGQL